MNAVCKPEYKLKTKKYRFFFHYRRKDDMWSIHFKGKCYPAEVLHCCVPCTSKKRDKQPRRIMEGWCYDVMINNQEATII